MEEDKKNIVLDELFKETAKLKSRTEKEILKDFEKLGYEIKENSDGLCLFRIDGYKIDIRKNVRKCHTNMGIGYISMQEHKLLYELFKYWKWI